MASTGDPRSAARIGAIVVLLAAVGGGLWWWTHRAGPPASSTGARPRPGSVSMVPAPPPTAPSAPARLAITVTDEHGPLAGATVRLAPRDGEVIAIRTGGDGVARADHLEPGLWHISASAADHVPAAPLRDLVDPAAPRLAQAPPR